MRSVVVPAYNEEGSIAACLKALLEIEDAEIIVSDDGSEDATLELARELARGSGRIRVVSGEHKGKGAALKRGFAEARGEVIGFLDADLSAPPSELEKLFRIVEGGEADLAIGSRDLPGSVIPVEQPSHRRLLGSAYSFLARALLGLPIKDFQCGCKAFTREVLKALDLREDGFVFDTELIAQAAWKGYRVVEVPILWRDEKGTKVKALRDPLRMMLGLLRLRRRLGRRGAAGKGAF